VANSQRKVVTLHPAAINKYLADVERLRKALDDADAPERRDLAEPIRRLLHSVVVASPVAQTSRSRSKVDS
jgi:hypothetical protein